MPRAYKDPTKVCILMDSELSDEVRNYTLLNGITMTELIRAAISSFLDLYGNSSLGRIRPRKKRTTINIEAEMWQEFGRVCDEIGVSRSQMLGMLLKKILYEDDQN